MYYQYLQKDNYSVEAGPLKYEIEIEKTTTGK
jgi:hypothetical protein